MFEQMRAYLQRLYRGMTVDRSFAAGGQVFDCVPIGQQPGLLRPGLPAPPPPAPKGPKPGSGAAPAPHCGGGTIPMRRVTLDEITRFATLQDFLRKAPGAATGIDRPSPGSQP
jgi:hypothetical protein